MKKEQTNAAENQEVIQEQKNGVDLFLNSEAKAFGERLGKRIKDDTKDRAVILLAITKVSDNEAKSTCVVKGDNFLLRQLLIDLAAKNKTLAMMMAEAVLRSIH